LESKLKKFEAGQRGEGSDHHFGWNIPGMGYITKAKIFEVSGRQKQFRKTRKWNGSQQEEFQTLGRSTQERIGKDWRRFVV
jgi:hypothetical protein